MDNFNSYMNSVSSSMGEANTIQQQNISDEQDKARKQQEQQEPLNLLGAELLTSGIKGVRQSFVKKISDKIVKKTGSKALGKFVSDVGSGKDISKSVQSATSGVADEVTSKVQDKVQGAVEEATGKAKAVATQAQGAVEEATEKAQGVVDEAKSNVKKVKSKAKKVKSKAKKVKKTLTEEPAEPEPVTEPEQVATKKSSKLESIGDFPADYEPRPKSRKQVKPEDEEVAEPDDPIEAKRAGFGDDLLAPENQPFYDASQIDEQLQKEAKARALGDVKPTDRALENIKPYNKPENIKMAQDLEDSKNKQVINEPTPEPEPEPIQATPKFDPTAQVEGEFTGEGGQFKRGGLVIDAGEEQDKGISQPLESQAEVRQTPIYKAELKTSEPPVPSPEGIESDLPPLRKDVTLDEHLDNTADLNDEDYSEYKSRIKGIDPYDYSKKTQIVDDIKARPARVTEEARESLGLTEEQEDEEPESLPPKGSVENPLSQSEAPAPPPPRPTAEPEPEPEEGGFKPVAEGDDPLTKQDPADPVEPETPKIPETPQIPQPPSLIKPVVNPEDLDVLTADSTVFDENPLGDIVTAGLGLASLIAPLFSHAPKESPVHAINPTSQFGES